MKSIIFALALVAIAAAKPAAELVAAPVPKPVENENVAIIRSSFEQQPEGTYAFGYETADGSTRDENGELKEVLNEEKKPIFVVTVKGSYSYVDPSGKLVNVVYAADENGFSAEGDSIPKPVAAVSRR